MKSLLLLILLTGVATAGEVISNFSSRIEIQPDSNLIVTETIRALVEGRQIKRGIYRDFPIIYHGPYGLRAGVPFEVLQVLRDGNPENWRLEKKGNGIRIYVGRENVMIPPGYTTYTIKYRTGHQIGFFGDFDELYWNVTGNGWELPILEASACVVLPPGASVQSSEAYTGPQGSKTQIFTRETKSGCSSFLKTISPLAAHEGFTIVVTWPKGFVKAPIQTEKLDALLLANRGVVFGLLGLLIISAYFSVAWLLWGRDPCSGLIMPLYEPPIGFTPQDLRYLAGLGTCDLMSFTAAILHLAVQGAINIKQSKSKSYSLVQKNGDKLDREESNLFSNLFVKDSTIALNSRNQAIFTAAKKQFKKGVQEKNRQYFSSHTAIWMIGIFLTFIPLAISLLDANDLEAALFMLAWLTFWSFGCLMILRGTSAAWREKNKGATLLTILPALPFLTGWVAGLAMLIHAASIWVCLVFLSGILLCWRFHHLLKRPSIEGQKIRDHIKGFREYLSVAEADRLNLENPPERTPELFEKFLPYALALGVEQAWARQFSTILKESSYSPTWYDYSGSFRFATFSSGFSSSFSQAISSSSRSPGSSSGRSGSGSSGGGGGGGGGGGW